MMQEDFGVTVEWCTYPCHIYMEKGLWVASTRQFCHLEESSTQHITIKLIGTRQGIIVPR